jgi:hypothetical protein
VIDTGSVRIVCIDPDPTRALDGAQSEWLRRVASETPLPKLLISTRTTYLDGVRHDIRLSEEQTLDDLLEDPA